MRPLRKLSEPAVLSQYGANWLRAWLADRGSVTKRSKYRHPDIRATLVKETAGKCVYCESFLGATAPGQTEHIVPSSKEPTLHFAWHNLTRACAECNRRKNDYLSREIAFLNPYVDDVDGAVEHWGPVTQWRSGSINGEVAVRVLGLAGSRIELTLAKVEVLARLRQSIELFEVASEPVRSVRLASIRAMASPSAEYSAMIESILVSKGLM